MILAEKIMRLRKQQGWSQEDLAIRLDVSRQSVSKWESGASLPDLDKILQLGELFSVSTDFLLKDEIEEPGRAKQEGNEATEETTEEDWWKEEKRSRTVSREEANDYLTLVRKISWKNAAAVSVCVLSAAPLIVLAGIAENRGNALTEDTAGILGVIILLIMIACAVAVFISTGMQLEKYSYLEKEPVALSPDVTEMIQQMKENFDPTKRVCIIAGVMICILSAVPLLCVVMLQRSEIAIILSVAVLLVIVAGAVFLFVYSGVIAGGYNKLLEEEDYTREKKVQNRRNEEFGGIYWSVVTAAYLLISFLTKRWDLTWLVFAVGGLLYAAVCGILAFVTNKKTDREL